MAKTRSYKRHFIILENEDKGFENNRENLPKGYVKIEVRNGKGILNIYTQDLKHFEDAKYIYRNYLINTKDRSYVDLGTLVVDEKGKGEYKLKIDPDNVEGTGNVLEDFNVVAIVAEPLDRYGDNKVFGPLVGYINKKKTEWKPSVLENKNNKKKEENIEATKEEQKPKEDIKKEIKENKEVEEAQENNKAKEVKEIKPKVVKKAKEVKETEMPKKEKENKKIEKAEEIKEAKEQVKEEVKKEVKEEVKEIKEATDAKKAVVAEEVEKEKEEPIVKAQENDKKAEAPIENLQEIEENQGIEAEEELSEEYKEKHEKIMKIIEEESKELYKEKENADLISEENHENVESEEDILKTVKAAQEKAEKQNNMKGKYYGGNKTYSQYEKYYNTVHRYVNDMLKYSEEIEPFENNIEGCKWWQMEYSQQNTNRVFLPFFGYVLNIYYYNPYVYYMNNCNDLMDKYGHYIFGIKHDKNNEPKYYIYGVPGRYLYKEQPFRGMTGFVYWHPIEDKKPRRGDYGYWLLHIDSKTGNIAFPFEPTIPPMY